ncbi:SusC/RagA family TonB-linked outer membrane protein [Desertivirga xinjiangensis]|uniref:SusC/RagA family TonB-linked outer membrane protein n=1 Tax=Desertivirga xinjiangensis TaxID=539206 RepID=UPI002108A788|nr:SusC/RagA family TonB-linked outer membrane protein [Pedobacter xinjiangensis]
MRKTLHSRSKKITLLLISSGILFPAAWSGAFAQGRKKQSAPDQQDTVLIASPEKVPQLFGTVRRDQLVQSLSYLNGKTLESSPVNLLSNALTGRLAGLYSVQTNGAPRFDNSQLSIRGRSPLVVIDGVPRYNLVDGAPLFDVLAINPEQVESVTLLKDGLSTVMLGNRGMDGVLMITTRNRGQEPGSSISITGQAGLQTPLGMRKPLSAFDYASLYNEALSNSGYSPVYSQDDLEKYRSGTDPYHFPNVNWRDETLRNNAPLQRYTLNAGGDHKNVGYFVSLDYQSQNGLFKEDPAADYGTNIKFDRYIFRSNVDLKVSSSLDANLNVTGTIHDYIQPGVGFENLFHSLQTVPQNASPVTNFQGSFAGNRRYPRNPYADAVASGYLKNNLQAASATLSLRKDLSDVIKGSWIKALVSYSPSYEQKIDRSKGYNAYNFPVTGDTSVYTRVNSITDQNNASSVIGRLQQTYLELSAGYDQQWKANGLSVLLLGSYESDQSNMQLNQQFKNISGRISYSYDQRFSFELAGAYSGNNWFAAGHQYGFYPGAGLSWNAHKEPFLRNFTFLNELKLRASWARVGNADPGYFLFRQGYVSGSGYFFGTGATSAGSYYRGTPAHNRDAEKSEKLNVGFDIAYAKQRGWFSFDFYNNRQYDLLQVRGNNTGLFGQEYPLENLGRNRFSGIEITTGWAAGSGRLKYSVSGNLSTVASKVIDNDEPEQIYPWMSSMGHAVNQIRGYVAEGFFGPDNLGDASVQGYTPQPGDIKYTDLNNDGIINGYDRTVIGNNHPLVFYGVSTALRYAGFDFSMLVQGVANRDILTNGDYQFAFGNDGLGQAYEHNLNRWTPATAGSAVLPRVTIGSNPNNSVSSSLYVRNGNYLRLKNTEIGYTFKAGFLPLNTVKKIRVFVNGQNLLTFSKFKDADPENYTGLYPIQRVINGGLSLKL